MKGSESPIIKFGLIALVVLAVVFAIMKFTGAGGGDSDGIGTMPEPKFAPVDPIDPANVIGNNPNDPKSAAGK